MSFGYGIDDFVAVGQLCWKVYKKCKDSPGNHTELSSEVGALHNVIKETEELFSQQSLTTEQEVKLVTCRQRCEDVLKDLDGLLVKFESLGTNSRRTFDRMGFGMQDMNGIRLRLISNVSMLDAFNNACKLNLLIAEVRAGKRKGSVISTQTFDTTAENDRVISTLRNQDALLCCVPGGQTKVAAQKLLIDAAIEAGVRLTFASDYVANIFEFTLPDFPDGIRLELGVAGFDIPARRATIYGAGNNLACWTSLPVIPTAVVNMLLHQAAIVNRGILISGVRNPTHNKILAALEAETGKELNVEQGDVNKIKSGAMEKLEKGELKTATRGLMISAQSNDEEGSADFWDLVEDEAVGVQAVDVGEAVSEYLLEQKLKLDKVICLR